MLSQPQDTLELQQKQTKTVAVTSMSFALGEVGLAKGFLFWVSFIGACLL